MMDLSSRREGQPQGAGQLQGAGSARSAGVRRQGEDGVVDGSDEEEEEEEEERLELPLGPASVNRE